MNLKAAISLSCVLHVAVLGYLHTLEVPEPEAAEAHVLRQFASVRMKVVEPDEVSEDGSDDPAQGVPDPALEAPPEVDPEPPPRAEPEPEPEPDRGPEPEPEPEPEPKSPPEPAPVEELKSVVADKTDDSTSPVETASEAEATARAAASTAPVDSGNSGDARGSARPSPAAAAGSGSRASGPRGVRRGNGEDQKKLNQKYGLVLYREINRVKSYPRFARKAHIEGKLLVAVTVDRHGKILGVEVRESSGHDILDENTVETIRGLKRLPVAPEGLTWQTKTFVLPVSYKLT